MITVQVKTPKEKQSVEIEENSNVRKVNIVILYSKSFENPCFYSLRKQYR